MTEKIKQNDFHQNQNSYAEVLADFRAKLAAVSSHGPAAAIEKHRSRGKLLARERIEVTEDGLQIEL